MKFLIFVISVLAVSAVQAEVCKVTSVIDTSFFEESLSVDEYPDVYFAEDGLYIGASKLSTNDYSFRTAPTVGFDSIFVITSLLDDEKYSFHTFGLPMNREGTLTGKRKGQEEILIAELKCN